MKKEMSAFDVMAMVQEMQGLLGSFVDKFFQWDKSVLIRFNRPGTDKRELYFEGRKFLYMPSKRPGIPDFPSNFAVNVRKHINNARVVSIRQQDFDRIVVIDLEKAENYQMVLEMFGGGNVLLIKDGVIVNCLVSKTWRHRQIRPGAEYGLPPSRFDPLVGTEEDVVSMLRDSSSDLVRTLATSVNLGGQYGEEVCLRADVDKRSDASGLDEAQMHSVYEAIASLVSAMDAPEPTMVREDDVIVDVSPMSLRQYDASTNERVTTLSEGLETFLRSKVEEAEEARVDPEVQRLRRQVDRQRESIEATRAEAESLRVDADALYVEYTKVDELLRVLAEQSGILTWDRLRAGASKIDYVRSIDPAKGEVVAEVDGRDVTLEYASSIDANANRLYQRSKSLREKADRAEVAMNGTVERLERREKGVEKERVKAKSRAQPTKRFWFESYRWFFTSGGRLVMAGRDARSNDKLVKKHLKDVDRYAHADVHGAPSVVVKEGSQASAEEMREACEFALAQSKAWSAAIAEGGAYWVLPDQVTKTPMAGEFVPRGAFIIRGKRNYEFHLGLEMAVGEVDHQGNRKVMCGPPSTIVDKSPRYVIIRPTKDKNRNTAELARAFDVPEEEISGILPPGNVEIVRRVGLKE